MVIVSRANACHSPSILYFVAMFALLAAINLTAFSAKALEIGSELAQGMALVPKEVRHLRQSTREKEERKNAEERVIIYTFFDRVSNDFSTEEYDREMIKVWADSWREMGWEPRVLTLEDAKKHSRFEEYDQALEEVQLVNVEGREERGIGMYNRFCYLRWLAMAAVGGGFMSDYDVVSTKAPQAGDEQPSTFTLYDNNVPGLMSGSANEWERLSWLILDYGRQHTKRKHELSSDMTSLQGLVTEGKCDCKTHGVAAARPVATALSALKRYEFNWNQCDFFRDRRGVHFSHYSVQASYQQDPSLTYNIPLKKRPDIMRKWFELYKSSCLDKMGF